MFGLKYTGEFISKFEGIHWRIEIAERGYNGESEPLEFTSDDPLTITWEKQGDEFYEPIKASEVSILLNCNTNFKYINLFTADPRKYKVSIYRNLKLYWAGFTVADLYSEEFAPPPYDVELKAVDGFSLLESIKFLDTNGAPFTSEKMSLFELVQKCYDVLELGLDIADWTDIYAENMDETKSPLTQIFIEIKRIYSVYEDATYRDVLNLVLKSFAYQIFQSNGALHIRGVKSLYSKERPLSYHNIAGVGHILTHTGEYLTTHTGAPIMTTAAREIVESMWAPNLSLQSTSTLNVTPPIKSIKINVDNKLAQDVADRLGFFDPENWSVTEEETIEFDDKKGKIFAASNNILQNVPISTTTLKPISASIFGLNIKFDFSPGPFMGGVNIPVRLKFIAGNTTYYVKDNLFTKEVQEFENAETSTRNTPAEIEFKFEKLPYDGCFVLERKQQGYSAILIGATIEWVDSGDLLAGKLMINKVINKANNLDYEIDVPVADVPMIPNANLTYELYFVDSELQPINKKWHSKGSNNYNTLINILASTSLLLRRYSSKRIDGNMHTSGHIDMNTVLQDDKFLKTGFYINSLSVKCYSDDYDAEFVEMPQLLFNDTPPVGDDSVVVANYQCKIVEAVKSGRGIFARTNESVGAKSKGVFFDTAIRISNNIEIKETNSSLIGGDNVSFAVNTASVDVFNPEDMTTTNICPLSYPRNPDGRPSTSLPPTPSKVSRYVGCFDLPTGIFCITHWFATTGRYFFEAADRRVLVEEAWRPGSTGGRRDLLLYTGIAGLVGAANSSGSIIGINLIRENKYKLWDCRIPITGEVINTSYVGQVLSVSDSFLVTNTNGKITIYRRNNVELNEMTEMINIDGVYTYATSNHTHVMISNSTSCKIYNSINNTLIDVIAGKGSTEPIISIVNIEGDFYIVREKSILKYIFA